MSSLFIRGETGETHQISSQSELKNVLNSLLHSTLTSQNDIIIFTNKGEIITRIETVEYHPDIHYFIYNKHFSNEITKHFNISIEKLSNPFNLNISINMNSIPDIKQSMPLLIKSAKYLKSITPQDINLLYTKMIDFYENLKLIYKKMKLDQKICDKIKECYNYQFEGADIINKELSLYYEKCLAQRVKIEGEAKRVKEKSDEILKIFNESVEKLKVTELHPALRSQKNKFLIDIYFDENSIENWKQACIEKQKTLFEKILNVKRTIEGENKKIIIIKKNNMNILQNEWSILINKYDSLIREKSSKPSEMLKELENEFILFKTKLGAIVEIFGNNLYNSNPNYASVIDEAIESMKKLDIKYSDITLLSNIQTFLEPISECCEAMKNSMEKFPIKINEHLNLCEKIKDMLKILYEKLDGYLNKLTELENDFAYLQNPSHFPTIYNNYLIELKRRLIFNRKIVKDIDRLKCIVLRENLNRKQFLKENEKYSNPDFFRAFKFSEIRINIDLLNNNELENLPNVLNEEDEKLIRNGGYLNDTLILSKNSSNSNDDNKVCDDENLYKALAGKIELLEMQIKSKNTEIKKLQKIIEDKDKQIYKSMREFRALNSIYDALSESFFFQLSEKEKDFNIKIKECENLRKNINNINSSRNKNDTCPLCKERALKSSDYQTTMTYIKDLNDKLTYKNKYCIKIEKSYQNLLNQTSVIKKTFFDHMNSVIEKKNNEISKIKSSFENKIMYLEDMLSLSNEKISKETNLLNMNNQLESKVKEYSALLSNNDKEIQRIRIQIEDYKQRENTLKIDKSYLQTKYDILLSEYKKLEVVSENTREKMIQKSDEIMRYIKEIQELQNELDNKKEENVNITKLFGKLKKENDEKVNQILSQQNEIISLQNITNELKEKYKIKINELQSNLLLKPKMQEEINLNITENEKLKQKVNLLENDISEKDKRINELVESNKLFVSNNQNENLNTKENTNALTNEINLLNSDFLRSKSFDEDIIYYKRIEKGMKCIFVPYSESIYVCINLSERLNNFNNTNNNNNNEDNQKFFKCKYILDLNSFEEEMRQLIVDNSLIVIGKIGKLAEYIANAQENPYGLPENEKFMLVTLEKMEYVIGFPGEEIVFRNYIC